MAKILIVDDSKTSRKILRNLLESKGHVIIGEAKDGHEGVDKYKELQPDLVTMDISMPVLDGIESLKQIMNIDKNAAVVMITAAGQKNKIMEAVKYGAAEFITKPYEPEKVLIVIQNVIDEINNVL